MDEYDLAPESADEEKPQKAPNKPPAYLPRVKFSEPEPAEESKAKPKPPAKSAGGSGRKSASRKSAIDPPSEGEGERKGVLLEETPDLDTYDTRRKFRLAIGAVAGIAIIGAILLVYRGFSGEPETDDASLDEAQPPVVTVPVNEKDRRLEGEARLALEDAKGLARRGQADNAVKRLETITKAYPKTAAGKSAEVALAHAKQGLPLFPDGAIVLAKSGTKTDAPQPETKPSDSAHPATAPATAVGTNVPPPPIAPIGPAPAVLPPPTPAEAFHATGLSFDSKSELSPRALPAGFRPRSEAGVHPSGWPWEITCDKDGAAMRLVPGGEFILGREDGPNDERPAHRVKLSTFYIDQHEVTGRQFRLYRKEGPAVEKNASAASSEDAPVVMITAREAKNYAEWAGKKLPSEAQWEAAARTTDARLFPWGSGPPQWSGPRKPGQIDPVMSFALDLSPYGVFDLAGNAQEWTGDWYESRYYSTLKGTVVDPPGPTRPKGRGPALVVKGSAKSWEVSTRTPIRPETKMPNLGFRCVLQVETLPGGGQPGAAPGGGPSPTGGLIPF